MDYSQFYKKAELALIEAMTSLWVPGHPNEIKHIKDLLERREPIMAEPEFQTIFPWETSSETFQDHAERLGLFDSDFVKSLSSITDDEYKEYNFPLDRHPYKHQTNSWRAMLKDRKTIVVTTGTGSGKTECFMLPVLQDLYDQRKKGVAEGVQAIFLYPLNALMKNQQRRIHAWCKSLPSPVTYAIYNGETERERLPRAIAGRKFPQICSREEIRDTPPQILFTNPTMLNYMLVRDEDQRIINASKGKLRWILLDEAHTYTGSSATELALQIRQVTDAFGVSIDDVNFALTSATIGDSDVANALRQLKENAAKLTGKHFEDIVVVDGKRIIPDLNESKVETALNTINREFGTQLATKDIVQLRKDLNEKPCLSSKEITERFHEGWSVYERLRFINALGNKHNGLTIGGGSDALLPTRAHFFIRSINGIYTCLNPDCPSAKEGTTDVGALTTYQRLECPHCRMPLLEVGTCSECGGLVVTGEYDTKKGLRMRVNTQELDTLSFYAPDEDAEDDTLEQEGQTSHHHLFVIGHNDKPSPRSSVEGCSVAIDVQTKKIRIASDNDNASIVFTEIVDKERGNELCPHCANAIANQIAYFRASPTFMSRIISPILLDNADPIEKVTSETLYEGKKYIAFTDSRQGTAKGAMQQNLDVERRWIRSAIFHELADRRSDSISLSVLTEGELQSLEHFQQQMAAGIKLPPMLQSLYEELLTKQNGNSKEPEAKSIFWDSLEQKLLNDKDFKRLAGHMNAARRMSVKGSTNINHSTLRDYLQALFIDQFGWIPKRGNTLETLGFAHLVYPSIANAKVPSALAREGLSDKDWQSYLKICIDYFVRAHRCISITDTIIPYLQQSTLTREVYETTSTLDNVLKWPCLAVKGRKVEEKQQRIVLILCAALGITDFTSVTQEQKELVNSGLQAAWIFLRDNVLTETDHTNRGYRLDMINGRKVAVQLITEGWLCPVNNVIVDVRLKDYSPRIKGGLNVNNFARYKVSLDAIHFPYYPYAYKVSKDEAGQTTEVSDKQIREWTRHNWSALHDLGVYRQVHIGVLQNTPIFMAGEHSAQQQRDILEKYEKDFNEGRLNILSCSTTMEMGVDLKGISEVVMNTVPPKSANYLQRAGRAGRRGESKAMAVTFCSPTPVAMNAWNNPSWPMIDRTQMPQIKLESVQIIQRHVNSLLFAKFISSKGGMRITDSVRDFFIPAGAADMFMEQLDHYAYDVNIDVKVLNAYLTIVKGTALEYFPFQNSARKTTQALTSVQKTYKDRLAVLEDSLARTQAKSKANGVLSRKLKDFQNQSILTFLAENSFLPTAGIPTGLVPFMPQNDRYGNNLDKLPTQPISQAIANYAPGKQVVINEWCYESAGISLKTKYDDTKKNILQSCSHCGYTTIVYGAALHDCPVCRQHNTMQGVKDISIGTNSYFTEIVEPAAFSVSFGYEPRRTMRPKSSMDLIQPVLLNMVPWPTKRTNDLYAMRCSTPQSEILVYNKGKGKGYAYCPYCGVMKSESHYQGEVNDDAPLALHKHFETGGTCDGAGANGQHIHRNVLLVGHYQTDFVELKFYNGKHQEILDEETLYSLGVIISRKLTEILGVNEGEIDFGYCGNYHSIFIYDTAIGGAGYSTLLRDYKEIVLDEALKSLNMCDCSSACTHCLIDRHSQWYINYLDRNKALNWLQLEHDSRIANNTIRKKFEDACVITSDFLSELYAVSRDENLKAITIFVDADISKWLPESFVAQKRLEELKIRGVTVNYVLNNEINGAVLSAEQQSILMSVMFKEKLCLGTVDAKGMQPLMITEMSGGSKTMYFGDGINTSFNSSWGQGHIFFTKQVPALSILPINEKKLLSSMNTGSGNYAFEVVAKVQKVSAEGLFGILLNADSTSWQHIKETIKGKSVSIEYTDKYLLKPIDVYILARFIESIKNEFNLQVSSIRVNFDGCLSKYQGARYEDYALREKFEDQPSREMFTRFCFENYAGVSPTILTTNVEHSRPMVFMSDEYKLVIRPDAGIAHSWGINKDRYSEPDVLIGDLIQSPNTSIGLYSYNWDRRTNSWINSGELFLISLKRNIAVR